MIEVVGVAYKPNFARNLGQYRLERYSNVGLLTRPHVDVTLTREGVRDHLFDDTTMMITLSKDHSFIGFQPGTVLKGPEHSDALGRRIAANHTDLIRELGRRVERTLTVTLAEEIVPANVSGEAENYLVELYENEERSAQRLRHLSQLEAHLTHLFEEKVPGFFHQLPADKGKLIFQFAPTRTDSGKLLTRLKPMLHGPEFEGKVSAATPIRSFVPTFDLGSQP